MIQNVLNKYNKGQDIEESRNSSSWKMSLVRKSSRQAGCPPSSKKNLKIRKMKSKFYEAISSKKNLRSYNTRIGKKIRLFQI